MPYEVCYRALLSISVVEGLKPHTTLRPAAARRRAARRGLYNPLPRPALAGLDQNVSVFRFHPQDSLAGGPPARWFVIDPAQKGGGGRPQARGHAGPPQSCRSELYYPLAAASSCMRSNPGKDTRGTRLSADSPLTPVPRNLLSRVAAPTCSLSSHHQEACWFLPTPRPIT